MRSKSVELTVGIFILAGFLAIAFLAIRVSGLNVSAPEDSYSITARFENIGGLKPRAKVTMAGVFIGRVNAIRIHPESYTAEVEMAILSQYQPLLSTDSSASILTAGMLGEKYIGITVGADEEVLEAGDRIYDTQSALILEELIGKFLVNFTNKQDD